ncbi:retrotransposon protein, putative, ty1-copia subclass [Tanacetum coccineum]
MVRSMMSQTTLLKSFWDYAVESAARILNMVPTKKVEKTPYVVWHGQSLKMSYLRVWGCEALDTQRKQRVTPSVNYLRTRSTRTRHAPNRMCLYINAKEHELGDHNKLANYKAALLDHESGKWLAAMNVEVQSMKNNQVWNLVDLPPNVKGFTQTYGVNYGENFSPIADFRAIRIPLAIVVFYDYKIWQMDVKTANQVWEAAHILGIKIYKDRSRRLIGLCQSAYIEKILKRFNMENSKRGSVDDCKSHTGHVFVLNGGDVNRKSTKQSIFATSSAKDEYIAASDASKEAVWIRKFIYGLGVVPTIEEPMKIYYDNTGAIAIANETVITKGAIHYRAKVHYLREVIEFGDIKLVKVHTDDNLVDPFTKALPFNKHFEHTKNIGLLLANSLM